MKLRMRVFELGNRKSGEGIGTGKESGRSHRPKWYLFRIVAIIIIASIGAIANVAVGETGKGFAQESAGTPPAGLISSDALFKAPAGVLPSRVYVLNNRKIVTEKPSSEMDKLQATAEEPSSLSETASRSATIRASVTAASSRLIVVDENDRIIEIWSNTTGTKRGFYSLRVREGSWQGVEHPLSPGVLDQYNRLLGEVDWSINGRAYSAEIY